VTFGEFCAIGAFVLAIVLAGYLAVKDGERWQEFSETHECKKVGETSGSTSIGYGIAANGQGGMVSTYTPGKTGWACNDGVTYWR
jgi:hypothetical protein